MGSWSFHDSIDSKPEIRFDKTSLVLPTYA